MDVRERKKAEAALLKTVEELKHSNAELEQFAYVASNDPQEPLRMVVGFLQLLQQRNQARLDEKADGDLEYAVDGALPDVTASSGPAGIQPGA